ncbi:hypothetical protein [Methanobacterium sp.]|uniref:hypothetical protein n=1 Tax=Methanobacterium sp. TaxID=2164 RepID=UPI003C725EA7
MTCVIGLIEDGTVYMGADRYSRGNDYSCSILKKPKIFKKENMLFGIAGYSRIADIIHYCFEIPERKADEDTYHYLCNTFFKTLSKCMEEYGHMGDDEGASGILEFRGTILLGYEGELFEIGCGFEVIQNLKEYHTIGSGLFFASGAMEILKDDKSLSPQQKIKKALEVTSDLANEVAPPFDIIRLY